MRIKLSKQLPATDELMNILKREFSNRYSFKMFGLGKQSILVGKSSLIGAQVSIRQNEVSIDASPPSFFGSVLQLIGITELAVFLLPFLFVEGLSSPSKYRVLEKDIGTFLVHKYS